MFYLYINILPIFYTLILNYSPSYSIIQRGIFKSNRSFCSTSIKQMFKFRENFTSPLSINHNLSPAQLFLLFLSPIPDIRFLYIRLDAYSAAVSFSGKEVVPGKGRGSIFCSQGGWEGGAGIERRSIHR